MLNEREICTRSLNEARTRNAGIFETNFESRDQSLILHHFSARARAEHVVRGE